MVCCVHVNPCIGLPVLIRHFQDRYWRDLSEDGWRLEISADSGQGLLKVLVVVPHDEVNRGVVFSVTTLATDPDVSSARALDGETVAATTHGAGADVIIFLLD